MKKNGPKEFNPQKKSLSTKTEKRFKRPKNIENNLRIIGNKSKSNWRHPKEQVTKSSTSTRHSKCLKKTKPKAI